MGERLSFASGYMEGTHAGRGAADCGVIKKKSACIGAVHHRVQGFFHRTDRLNLRTAVPKNTKVKSARKALCW